MARLRMEGARAVTDPRFSFMTRLEGRLYRFRMAWNVRGGFWTLDIATEQGKTLFQGHRITEGMDMLRSYCSAAFPPGQLIAVDNEGQGREPGRYAFRDSHDLVYVEAG